jgi:hypothetical protein
MMGEKALEECEVCTIEIETVETSCCEEEKAEEPISISSENPVCCQDEFVYNKVKDDFIFTKSEKIFFLSFENLSQTVTLIPPLIDFQKEESFYCDSSPPFLINPEIHISNAALLI